MPRARTTPPIEADEATVLLMLRSAAEVTLKARGTRDAFRRRFKANLGDALRRAELRARISARFGRTLVALDPGDEAPEEVRRRAVETVTRVFGVGSCSPVEARCPAELDAIVAAGAATFGARVRGRRYAVRCKRTGHHPFSSVDVERALGSALNQGATVDLEHPEVTVEVEVQGARAWLFAERVPGPGGLPLGTGGRALALLSGGYDSAVAAWYVMKRGIEVDFVYARLGGDSSERRTLQVAKVLTEAWAAGSRPDLHVVDLRDAVAALRADAEEGYGQVLLKRAMLLAADGVADGIEALQAERAAARRQRRPAPPVEALVTGDALAQVSSQTLSNLRAIDEVARRPVLRPLIGFDKLEILARAEHIGTAALSAQVREECAITPRHPVTHARPERVAEQQERIGGGGLVGRVAEAVADARRIALRPLGAEDLTLPYLFVDAVPDGALLLDCRPLGAGSGWRPPGARAAPMPELLGRLRELDKGPTYVLFCPVGTQSAQAAEVMQQMGFEAYSFRGGAPALRRWLEGRPAGARGAATEGGP